MKSNVPEDDDEIPTPLKAFLNHIKKVTGHDDDDGLCDCDKKAKAEHEKAVRDMAQKILAASYAGPSPVAIKRAFILAESYAKECEERMQKLFPEEYKEHADHIAEVAAKRAALEEAKKAVNSDPDKVE